MKKMLTLPKILPKMGFISHICHILSHARSEQPLRHDSVSFILLPCWS